MKKTLLIVAALALVMGSGCTRNEEQDTELYKHVQADDQAMNAAIAQAKATSADFLRAFRAQQIGTQDFYVKKPYPTPSNGHEHMWIEVTAEHSGVLSGVIANDAEETLEVKLGDEVSVPISEISDWKYQKGHKLIGGYTIRYFVNQMSPQEKADFLKEAGFEL